MKISKELLIRESGKTGFRAEILEKVWRLMNVLEGIQAHPFLRERLVLKGGTALNLFIFELPRLPGEVLRPPKDRTPGTPAGSHFVLTSRPKKPSVFFIGKKKEKTSSSLFICR